MLQFHVNLVLVIPDHEILGKGHCAMSETEIKSEKHVLNLSSTSYKANVFMLIANP